MKSEDYKRVLADEYAAQSVRASQINLLLNSRAIR